MILLIVSSNILGGILYVSFQISPPFSSLLRKLTFMDYIKGCLALWIPGSVGQWRALQKIRRWGERREEMSLKYLFHRCPPAGLTFNWRSQYLFWNLFQISGRHLGALLTIFHTFVKCHSIKCFSNYTIEYPIILFLGPWLKNKSKTL